MAAPTGAAVPGTLVRIACAGIALVMVVGVGLAAWSRTGSGDPAAAATEDGMRVTADEGTSSPFVSSWGVALSVDVTFDRDRVVTGGTVLVETAGPDPQVSFTPRDGTDEDRGYPVPLKVDGGVSVGVEATVLPQCGVEVTTTPVFEIESTSASRTARELGSAPRADTATATDLSSWSQAVHDWCAMGVQAHLLGYRTTVEGGATQDLKIYNPGPEPALVVSAAQRVGDSQWEHAEVTVDGGSAAELTIVGAHVGPRDAPRVTVDGEPLRVQD